MATKRMFSNSVIDSDAFLDLPPAAQLLYFHIGMKTDDDGFVTGARRIMKVIGETEDDIAALIDSGFLIPFPESKVYVVTHFRINNDLKNDRYHPTLFQAEYQQMMITDNKVYCLKQPSSGMDTECFRPGSGMDTERSPKNTEKQKTAQPKEAEQYSLNPKTMIDLALEQGLDPVLIEQSINLHGCSPVYEAFDAWRKDMNQSGSKISWIDFPLYLNRIVKQQKND